jgi:hypothetical protein
MTTPIIRGGSRGWNRSSVSAAFGSREASLLSVLAPSVLRDQPVVVVTCHHLLYTQLDFASQKPLLQEYINSCGHLCDYYPKYHCELNFIVQYWGAAKLRFRVAGLARTLNEMERKMLGCLDDIPLEQIQRCVTTLFISFRFNLFADLQTGPHALFQRIVKVCPELKQHGPIKNTMVIAPSPPIWSHS